MSDPKKAVTTHRVKISATPAADCSAAALAPDAVMRAAGMVVDRYLPDAQKDFASNSHKPLHIYHDLQCLNAWVHGQLTQEAALFAAVSPEAATLCVSEHIVELLRLCAQPWRGLVPEADFFEDALRNVASLVRHPSLNLHLELTRIAAVKESKR
jgi:hypothetical protein